ncbi:sex peptide receptor-like [Ruditapes philippinarum]|uniref:sex peptide receptor-like n=1 Tax=Ruditapes philippinarum TaxID=129788 RepID=UPI00295ACBCC|nr:sex peptide receptor-like [Ruditapes philippinarum]
MSGTLHSTDGLRLTEKFTTTAGSVLTSDYIYEYDEYMYPGYPFERPFYLFIWEILVIITFILNFIVLSVFIRMKMLSPTMLILSAIAISDSLTGLVTLPAYILVFQEHESALTPETLMSYDIHYDQFDGHDNQAEIKDTEMTDFVTLTIANTTQYYETYNMAPIEGYTLSKNLCRCFMVTKFFLSSSFHTISMYLTLFLGIQRYSSIANPFTTEMTFSFKRTVIYCVVIFVLTPALHSYHLFGERATNGMCQWEMTDTQCSADCIYLWAAFVIRHFIPCLALILFTVMFICKLRKEGRQFVKMSSCRKQIMTRIKDNRRISFVVTAIVICRLLPEIPYCIFLLYNGIDKSVNNGKNIDLKTNRMFHMSYELALMISFQCNFYIYVIFNRNFRTCLFEKCKTCTKGGCESRLKQEDKHCGRFSDTALMSMADRD